MKARSMKWVYWTVVICCVLRAAEGYSSGAPDSACGPMFPSGHGVSAQSSASPYTLTPSVTTYSAGDTVSVTIAGGTHMGFFIQARVVGQSTAVGTWTVATDTQARCSNAALTHMNSASKTSLTLQWTAPSPSPGNIEFVATMVQTKTVFWTGIRSAQVADPSAPTVTSTTTTPASAGTPVTIDVAGCGTSKSCIRNPEGCDQSTCDYLLTWRVSGTTVVFEMSGTTSHTEGYIAMGLSADQKMPSTSVTHCATLSNGVVQVAQSYNNNYNNELVSPSQLGLSGTAGYYTNGRISCTFTREATITPTSTRVFDLGVNYNIFIASGPAYSGQPGHHDSTPAISSSVIDVTSTSFTDYSASVVISDLERAHGILMISAWMFCASVAIILARYYKNVWASSKLCGTAVWFAIHRALMITNLFCTVAAFIIIFIDAKRWSKWGVPYQDAHPYIGVIVTALVFINPLMAAFRPHPGTSKRPLFNWAHWAVGKSGHILAVVNIFIGINLPSSKEFTDRSVLWLVVAFVVFNALIEIVLEVEKCRSAKSNSKRGEMEMTSVGQVDSGAAPQPAEGKLIRPVFFLYIFVALAIWIAIVVLMAIGPL